MVHHKSFNKDTTHLPYNVLSRKVGKQRVNKTDFVGKEQGHMRVIVIHYTTPYGETSTCQNLRPR